MREQQGITATKILSKQRRKALKKRGRKRTKSDKKEDEMIGVLFVCHGNICRSPMAESVFTYLVKQAELEEKIRVDSAAAHSDELGNPPYSRTREVLERHHIPLVPHRARLLTERDGDLFDYIVGMDDYNIRDIMRILGVKKADRVRRLLDFTSSPRPIADPWYTRDFEATYRDIRIGSEALLRHITEQGI